KYLLNETPGSAVGVQSTSVRYSLGAPGLGSHVSCCVGPPGRNRSTTDLCPDESPDPARAFAASSAGKVSPERPSPRLPIRRNSRRLRPSQVLADTRSEEVIMGMTSLRRLGPAPCNAAISPVYPRNRSASQSF